MHNVGVRKARARFAEAVLVGELMCAVQLRRDRCITANPSPAALLRKPRLWQAYPKGLLATLARYWLAGSSHLPCGQGLHHLPCYNCAALLGPALLHIQ